MHDDITDIPGIRVGHDTNLEAGTGCTVILCDTPAMGGVDVRGGAPATRETDLLRPMTLVEGVNAIVLTGGSAFGLDAAIGVVNAVGDIVDPQTQTVIAGTRSPDFLAGNPFGNTTIAVVAINAALTKEQTNKVAQMAHDGMAQAIRPAHTMFDGDTVFALALGPGSQILHGSPIAAMHISAIGAAAAATLARAIVKAVRNATTLHGVPAVHS